MRRWAKAYHKYHLGPQAPPIDTFVGFTCNSCGEGKKTELGSYNGEIMCSACAGEPFQDVPIRTCL